LKLETDSKLEAIIVDSHTRRQKRVADAEIGIIGGSGLYSMPGLTEVRELRLETPFGTPSDAYVIGALSGRKVAFLARHGRGHRFMPNELNYRANIHGLKQLGVERVISLSAVGSLKEEHRPLDFIIPDQFVDRTRHRVDTFFGDGLAVHVGLGHPVCGEEAGVVAEACRRAGVNVKQGGTYLNMEGPQFSTKAESNLYRSWGMDVIGMTNLTEARLAREAELCYATVAMVTDYDCWHPQHEHVTMEQIVSVLLKNADQACNVVREAVATMPRTRSCKCDSALKNAIVTQKDLVPPATLDRLQLLVGKYFNLEQKAGT
jgi:5'-methylthioadenosine phosphorylase